MSRRSVAWRQVSSVVGLKIALLSVVGALLFQPAAQAYPGLANDTGYFTGAPGSTNIGDHDSILPYVAPGCSFAGYNGFTWNTLIAGNYNSQYMALPLNQSGGASGDKAQFRDFLYGQYTANRCGGWTRLGVAFIVHTMLGHTPGRSATLSQADWDEFNTRIINDASIVMSYNPSASPVQNSYARGFVSGSGAQDGYFYNLAASQNEPIYSFTSASGYNYSIKLRCANPAGTITTNIIVTPPVGRIESATCQAVTGGAFDPDRPDWSISVLVYIDGNQFGAEYPANQTNAGFNAAYGGILGNHGFTIPLPSNVVNGAQHTIEVVALGINASGGRDGTNAIIGTAQIGPCRDYALTPSTASSVGAVVTAGQPINFTHSVAKTGTTSSSQATVAVKQYIIQPGQPFNQLATHQDEVASCDPRYGSIVCPSSYDLPSRVFTSPATTVDEGGAVPAVDTSAMSAGTRICRMLALDPAAEGPDGSQVRNRWSAPACVTIGKKPFLNAINGDIWSGGVYADVNGVCAVPSDQPGVTGSSSVVQVGGAQRTYGAYAEYGLMSLHDINDFGSAGKPRTGIGLTFSNLATPKGNFSNATNHCLGDARLFYGDTPATNLGGDTVEVDALASGVYRMTGGITIEGGELAAGRHIVLMIEGDATITGEINYDSGPYTRLIDIPSFILIVTGNVSVSQDVAILDGYYQANGYFNTCAEAGEAGGIGLSSNICQNQLVVNGAVATGKLIARRVHGSDPASRHIPAERFVLRPDLFLSLYSQSQTSGQLRTVSENELPPRY